MKQNGIEITPLSPLPPTDAAPQFLQKRPPLKCTLIADYEKRKSYLESFCVILHAFCAGYFIYKLVENAATIVQRTEDILSPVCMKLLIVFLIVFHRSMASLETRSQSRLANSRLSGAPSDFSKFAQLVSPSSVKPFAPWDRVDGPSPLPTVARISFTCVLKGFCLGASLLPSLRAEYKVRQGLTCLQN